MLKENTIIKLVITIGILLATYITKEPPLDALIILLVTFYGGASLGVDIWDWFIILLDKLFKKDKGRPYDPSKVVITIDGMRYTDWDNSLLVTGFAGYTLRKFSNTEAWEIEKEYFA